MTLLRQAKVDKIADCIPELEVQGDADAELLVVGWGGTYGHLYSAVEHMRKNGQKVALAHFQYINPLPKNTADVLKKYKNYRSRTKSGTVCRISAYESTRTEYQPV